MSSRASARDLVEWEAHAGSLRAAPPPKSPRYARNDIVRARFFLRTAHSSLLLRDLRHRHRRRIARDIERASAKILVDDEAMLQRRKRALIAIESLAQTTRGSDRHGCFEIIEIVAVGVDDVARRVDRTSDSDRHHRVA